MAGPRRKGGGGGGGASRASGAGKPSRGGGKRANAPAASKTTTSSSSEADDASPNWLAYGAATLAVLAAAYLQSSSPEPPPFPPSPAAPSEGDVGIDPSAPRRAQEEPARDDPKKEAKSASASSSSSSRSASFGLDDVLGPPDGPDAPFAGLPVFVHRNGQPEPCGGGSGGRGEGGAEEFGGALRRRSGAAGRDPIFLTVWDTDAIVTRALVDSVLREGECRPTWGPAAAEGKEKEEGAAEAEPDPPSAAASSSFWEYCDMGPERTPILPDHDKLVAVHREDGGAAASSLPCHFHTREGKRIKSLEELADAARDAKRREGDAKALHLYAVPAGRLFMFAPSAVGEVFRLDHIASPRRGRGIELEALSVSPRVFDVKNFFTREEAADVVLAALEETDDRGRMRRSQTVGDGESSRRTSSSGWVPGTRTALALKWRAATMLGQTTFEGSMIDGLQVLRYGASQAYTPHFDFHSSPAIVEQSHDYDSSGVGTNRYATVLLYLTEPEEGGATVFVDGEESMPLEVAIAKLRGRTDDVSGLFEEGSWEETMAAQCESRLAVQPTAPRAVLFYSMMPTGERDDMSKHGGCPVLKGEKWAANMWFHNGPREGHPNAPRRGKDPPL